jgi:RES domain
MWTATALASELRPYAGTVWRIVEAQHRISTNRLTSDRREQSRLEAMAEVAKPDLPKTAIGLHYLLAAPFRYGHTIASRFRKANERPGIFYASEHEETAIAETAYWRLAFFARAVGFVPSAATSEHSSFCVDVSAFRSLDLTLPPFLNDEAVWTHPHDYTGCQALAHVARLAEVQSIRTVSARDSERRANIVILDPESFASQPRPFQTWHLRIEAGQLTALAAFPSSDRYVFTPAQFGLPDLPKP